MTSLERGQDADTKHQSGDGHVRSKQRQTTMLTEPSQASTSILMRNLSGVTPTLSSVTKNSTMGYLVADGGKQLNHHPKTLSAIGGDHLGHPALERTNTQPVVKSATRKKVPKPDDPTLELIRYKTDGNARQEDDDLKDSTQLHRYSKGQTKKPKPKINTVGLSKIQERKRYEKTLAQSTRVNQLNQAVSLKGKTKVTSEDASQWCQQVEIPPAGDAKAPKRKIKSKPSGILQPKKDSNLEETDYAIKPLDESEEDDQSTEELFFVQPDLMEDDDFEAGSEKKKLRYPFLPAISAEHASLHTLILDLDETLVHFMESKNGTLGGQFHVRPYAREFLQEMGQYFEVVIFTAAIQSYADWILDRIDDSGIIKHRLYREHVSQRRGGVYIKDLSLLGRDIDRMIIVDNNPDNFQLQPENGIFIKSWFGDVGDTALLKLAPILRDVGLSASTDVRVSLARVRESLAAERHKAKRLGHQLRE